VTIVLSCPLPFSFILNKKRMDRERLMNYIDDQVVHLSKPDLIKIAHILDPVVDSKIIDKEEGLYIAYTAIDIDTLRRIYDFIVAKLKPTSIE
jgi:hypothetical protein